MQGLKPHTREERLAIAQTLIPLFQQKFGDNLIAIALVASVARNADRAYSDLEMTVFLHETPVDEDEYLQRVYDGLLIEVEYITEAQYLELWRTLGRSWWAGGASPLVPLYNTPFIESLLAKRNAYQHPRATFLRRAARKQVESQECFGKVLNAIEADNRENLPFLLYDAVISLFATLAFLNETPFTTFALYVTEARQFPIKPTRFDDLLDFVIAGNFDDLSALRILCETVFTGMEALFAAEGYVLYDGSIEPNLPNNY
jgi:kanamycin nucleotidyltransferase